MSRQRALLAPILILAALLAGACLACQQQREEDRPYRTGTIERHANGSLRKAQLLDAAELEGLPAKPGGWVRFHASGVLRGLQLDRDQAFAGRVLPGDSYLWFDERGALESAWLARDTEIDGVPCDGGPGKISTGFYPDGRLRHVFLSRDAVLEGLPCRSSVLEPVEFHPRGGLKRATLSAPCTYRGIDLKRGQEVSLDEAGEVIGE